MLEDPVRGAFSIAKRQCALPMCAASAPRGRSAEPAALEVPLCGSSGARGGARARCKSAIADKVAYKRSTLRVWVEVFRSYP